MDRYFFLRILFTFLLFNNICSGEDPNKKVDVKVNEGEKTTLGSVSTDSPSSSSPTIDNSSRSAPPITDIPASSAPTSVDVPSPKPKENTDPTTAPSTTDIPSTITPHISNSICNISMKISTEKGNTDSKKCLCDGFHGNVDCSHIGITELQKDISFPQAISIAKFQGNKIANLKSDTFYNARTLIEMDLSFNQIDFISINAFVPFKKLIRLDLSHNRIWNLPKGMFEGLDKLWRLDISYNNLVNFFPGHFAKLAELRELIMKNNPIQELQPKHFEHLSKLEYLDLEATMLKAIPDHVFVFTPNLKILKLASNQLGMVPTEAFHVLDHLKTLDLSGNPVEVIHQEAFRGMRGLDTLYLDRMPELTTIEDYAFGDMIHLEELHCSYNFRLSEIEPYAFVRKSSNGKASLTQLFLRQNDLKKIPQTLLDWNPGLEMHLRDNPLHCDCHATWMMNTKLKNDFQSHARCLTPSNLEGVVLSQLKGQVLSCGLDLSGIVLIICGIVLGLLILVLLVSFFFWRRNYKFAKPHFYKVNKNVHDIDYTADDDF